MSWALFGDEIGDKDQRQVAGEVKGELEALGLTDPRVFLEVVGSRTATDFLKELSAHFRDDMVGVVAAMRELMCRATVLARASRNATVSPWLSDAVLYERARRDQEVERKRAEQAQSSGELWVPLVAKRRRVLQEEEGGVGSLVEKDRRELDKWTTKFVGLVRGTSYPAVRAAEATGDPERSLAELLGSSRSGTVKLRLRAWLTMSRWLVVVKGRSWPTSAADIVDYLHARMTEERKQAFPRHLASAVRWVESRIGLVAGARWSDEVLFKRCFEKVTAEAEEGRAVKRAPRIPVMVIAALELGVASLDVEPVLRVVMWMRLLKVYGAMRSDDLQRVRPDSVTLAENGFTAKLGRTKTTGGGKKVREMVVYVPREAWVAEPSWLQVGFELWRALAPWDRDHFLPRPLPNLEAFEKRACRDNGHSGVEPGGLDETWEAGGGRREGGNGGGEVDTNSCGQSLDRTLGEGHLGERVGVARCGKG